MRDAGGQPRLVREYTDRFRDLQLQREKLTGGDGEQLDMDIEREEGAVGNPGLGWVNG